MFVHAANSDLATLLASGRSPRALFANSITTLRRGSPKVRIMAVPATAPTAALAVAPAAPGTKGKVHGKGKRWIEMDIR